MRLKRLWAILHARNREFFRDRAAFGWNLLFPFLIVAGFGVIFGGKDYNAFKVGVFPSEELQVVSDTEGIPQKFYQMRHLEFVGIASEKEGLTKLRNHKIDFLLERGPAPQRYWISDTSPKGYIVERLFVASMTPEGLVTAKREAIEGTQIRYIDWLFPGILAMNMMFSALWGVGYVVVRYRKNGVLKRLKATPLTAMEYLSAQMLSRIFLLIISLLIVWVGCDLIFDFEMRGSYADLAVVFLLGSLSLSALGLLLAARGTSEEFTTGVLNFIAWPMMFLSEVWFSLEGAPEWVQQAALVFPLTHLLKAARGVMHDGATLVAVSTELIVLTVTTFVFLSLGAALFSWNK